jgi:hypothetical protein
LLLALSGIHTISVTAELFGHTAGTSAVVSGGANSFLQGTLNVVMLKV